MTEQEIKDRAPSGTDIGDKLFSLSNLDLINDVKFHKSRMRYKQRKKNSSFSGFKLKPL